MSAPKVPEAEGPGEHLGVESTGLVGGVSEVAVSLKKELVSLLVKLRSFLVDRCGWLSLSPPAAGEREEDG